MASISAASLSDLDLVTAKEMAAKRKITPTRMLMLPPMKEYAFSAEKIPAGVAWLFANKGDESETGKSEGQDDEAKGGC